MATCPVCGKNIYAWNIYLDESHGCKMFGDVQQFQHVTACIGCGTKMHAKCVKTVLPGRFIRYANLKTRNVVDPLYPYNTNLPACDGCHDRLVADSLDNLQASGNFELAAQFLEHLGRFTDAGAMRHRARTQTVRTVQVDLNALLERVRSGGLVVDFKCPSCGAPLRIDGAVREAGLTSCPYCHASIDTMTAVRFIERALGE